MVSGVYEDGNQVIESMADEQIKSIWDTHNGVPLSHEEERDYVILQVTGGYRSCSECRKMNITHFFMWGNLRFFKWLIWKTRETSGTGRGAREGHRG